MLSISLLKIYLAYEPVTPVVRMAEWSKAPDSRVNLTTLSVVECSGPRMWAWVQIPLLTKIFNIFDHIYTFKLLRQ